MAVRILYEIIRDRRNELKLSQQELSEDTGVNVNTIKALETGRMNTSKENISKIAERLGLNIDDVYFEDFRNTNVITIANNKGGSSKTSVCSGLGYALSEIDNNRILLIDSDMQMNLSYSYGLERSDNLNLNIALRKEENLLDYIIKTNFNNIDIIISDFQMATMEMVLFTKTLRETVFMRILKPVIEAGIYDYIIIDTNPTLGMLNLNVLNASDYVIIPVEMTKFGLLGLEIIISFIEQQAQKINNKLDIIGILRTRVDIRENITHDAEKLLKQEVGDKTLETFISVDTNIKRSQWESDPILPFRLNSRVAEQYRALAKEVIRYVR